MPGRNILEGAVILHETIHELHTKKPNGIIFKIDFEKAFAAAVFVPCYRRLASPM
jgi:hypothetical protein